MPAYPLLNLLNPAVQKCHCMTQAVFLAVARPIPLFAPVINIRFIFVSIYIFFFKQQITESKIQNDYNFF